jgi:hypothetical protein
VPDRHGILDCETSWAQGKQAEFVSLPIPARAELVLEGLAHPGDVEMEGPLGEFHGFYRATVRPSRRSRSRLYIVGVHR